MIEDITEQELQEAVHLHRKGWALCNDTEQKRWVQLQAKATLASNQRGVTEYLDTMRQVKSLLQ